MMALLIVLPNACVGEVPPQGGGGVMSKHPGD